MKDSKRHLSVIWLSNYTVTFNLFDIFVNYIYSATLTLFHINMLRVCRFVFCWHIVCECFRSFTLRWKMTVHWVRPLWWKYLSAWTCWPPWVETVLLFCLSLSNQWQRCVYFKVLQNKQPKTFTMHSRTTRQSFFCNLWALSTGISRTASFLISFLIFSKTVANH